MKILRALVITIGLISSGGAAFAGTAYCPPDKGDKCPIVCSPDSGGSISFGYGTDYVFYGVRRAGDHIWTDVNYTFDQFYTPITLGVKHISSLGSNLRTTNAAAFQVTDNYGDETRLYASVGLPCLYGFESSLTYTHYLYPTLRGDSPNVLNGFSVGRLGDSAAELSLEISRQLFCGVTLSYRGAYDFNNPRSRGYNTDPAIIFGQNTDAGAWVHDLGLEKVFCLRDGVTLELSGGVVYSDNYWSNTPEYHRLFPRVTPIRGRYSNWNSYYLKAALPVAISCRATLTPFVAYNGSPDTWVADGLLGSLDGFTATQQYKNSNDVLHGGVSLKVDF